MKNFATALFFGITATLLAGPSAKADGLSGTVQPLGSIQLYSYDNADKKIFKEWQVSPQTIQIEVWDGMQDLTISPSSAIPMCGHEIGKLVDDLRLSMVINDNSHAQKTVTVPKGSIVFDLCDDHDVLKIIQIEASSVFKVE